METNKNLKIDITDLACSTFIKSSCFKIIKSLYSRVGNQNGGSLYFSKIIITDTIKYLVGHDLYVATFTHTNGNYKSVFVRKDEFNELMQNWIMYKREKNID